MGQSPCCCADDDSGIEIKAAVSRAAADLVKLEERLQQDRYDIVIEKEDASEILGMDVRHVQGRLVVSRIAKDGAVAKANARVRSSDPPGNELQIDDVIVEVNSIYDNDIEMVKECQRGIQLHIKFVRRTD
eukprot:TRINITY_DN113354_c0_g1_i2.p1 TRINITY_DN113354_c0_g1~~TRINITY_DN113354_c0_g1_i2.p1  ORF type:complete len:131 (-),score=32.20 TRINITY_DN113354_c0_g1_i2:112-504(-)